FKTTEDLIKAFLSPAVNVRHHAFVMMAEKGEQMITPVKKLLTNDNPYVQARAVWLLAALGERGIEETKQLLKHPDHMIRVTALRALRQKLKLPDFLPI